MRIGIDARLYGLEHAGIGRYVMNLVDRLIEDPAHQWVLFVAPKYLTRFTGKPQVTVIESPVRHYSMREQTTFLKTVNQAHLDLFHVPHFNVPLLYHRPFVVTIHDILWHQVRGGSVTTLSPWMYYLKYLGYRLIVRHALFASKAVFVPSQYVKNDLLKTFPTLNASKITVTYEGIDPPSRQRQTDHATEPMIVYIGSAYPHKNLTILFQTLKWLRDNRHIRVKLMVVGSRSIFLDQMKTAVAQAGITSLVTFTGYQSDAAIKELLHRSLCLVHPSKSEGFGLTGLEAMACDTPVIAAKATALPEIYGDAAIYFDPDDYQELGEYIEMLLKKPELRQTMIKKGRQQISQFSWDRMVAQTKAVYGHH